MRIKGSILADQIIQDWQRERHFKELAKRIKQNKNKKKEEQNSIK